MNRLDILGQGIVTLTGIELIIAVPARRMVQ